MKKRKGFTLVEIIVVLAIIAILIAIALPRMNQTKKSAEIVAHDANVTMIKNAATLYLIDHQGAQGNITEEVKAYLEGNKYPAIPSFISTEDWQVVLNEEGEVIVTPIYDRD